MRSLNNSLMLTLGLSIKILQEVFSVADRVVEVGSLYFSTLDVFALREVDDLLLHLVQFVLVHAQALHHYRGLGRGTLAEMP